jgi:hypothetical protein
VALDEPVRPRETYDPAQGYYTVRDLDTLTGVFHADELFDKIVDARGQIAPKLDRLERRTLMPFKSLPPKKGQLRRIALRFKSDMTRKQMASFRKSVRALAKRFKATISK